MQWVGPSRLKNKLVVTDQEFFACDTARAGDLPSAEAASAAQMQLLEELALAVSELHRAIRAQGEHCRPPKKECAHSTAQGDQ